MSIKDMRMTLEMKEQLENSASEFIIGEDLPLFVNTQAKLDIAAVAAVNAGETIVPTAEDVVKVLIDQQFAKYHDENHSLVNDVQAIMTIAHNNLEIAKLEGSSIFGTK